MAPLVRGLGNLVVKVRRKIYQQIIRWSKNLRGISESEKVSFQMLTERLCYFMI